MENLCFVWNWGGEVEKEEGKENVTLLFTVQGFSWKTEDHDIISNWFSEDKGDTQLEFNNLKTQITGHCHRSYYA